MKHYIVISPEVGTVIPILDDGSGPTEYGCCVVSVEANNRREALKKAINTEELSEWVNDQRSDGKNPFSGLAVIDPVCKHGTCNCDICGFQCEACMDECEPVTE